MAGKYQSPPGFLPEQVKCSCPIDPILTRARGVAFGVQNSYADWQWGMRRGRRARIGYPAPSIGAQAPGVTAGA